MASCPAHAAALGHSARAVSGGSHEGKALKKTAGGALRKIDRRKE